MIEVFKPFKALKTAINPDGQRLAIMEGPKNCNRRCDECVVPKRWDIEMASTAEETFRQIDAIYQQGYRMLNYVGGEPLAPFETKEGITFFEHTLKVVEHASQKGMLVNVTTNGDFVNEDRLKRLEEAGLDILTLSLHSINESGLRYIIDGAKMAAEKGIVPIVSVIFTADRNFVIPQIAEVCAQNGILFSTTIVQEKGQGFSSAPKKSRIPTLEQREVVFDGLTRLKKEGFVRNNRNYLERAAKDSDNLWRCDPQKDPFIHIRADKEGEVGVCSETPTGIQINELDLNSKSWRNTKQKLIKECSGCLYACTFEAQNFSLKGELPTAITMLLIKSGNGKLAELLGKMRVKREFPEDKLLLEPEEAFFVQRLPYKLLSPIKENRIFQIGISALAGSAASIVLGNLGLAIGFMTMGGSLCGIGMINFVVKDAKKEDMRDEALRIAFDSEDVSVHRSKFQAALAKYQEELSKNM